MPTRSVKPIRQREGAPPRTAYTIPEVAESIGLSKRQVYRLIQRDELAGTRLGGKLVVLVEEFQRYIREQAAAASTARRSA